MEACGVYLGFIKILLCPTFESSTMLSELPQILLEENNTRRP
jgi:hypothetical protein